MEKKDLRNEAWNSFMDGYSKLLQQCRISEIPLDRYKNTFLETLTIMLDLTPTEMDSTYSKIERMEKQTRDRVRRFEIRYSLSSLYPHISIMHVWEDDLEKALEALRQNNDCGSIVTEEVRNENN